MQQQNTFGNPQLFQQPPQVVSVKDHSYLQIYARMESISIKKSIFFRDSMSGPTSSRTHKS